jgi:hypothetical protein
MSSTGTAQRNSNPPSPGGAQPGRAKPNAPQGPTPARMPPGRTWGWLALLLLAN